VSELIPIETVAFDRPLQLNRDFGWRGKFDWIDIDRLVIDRSYQRLILVKGKINVRRIAEQFEWALFAPLVVAPREKGRFAIIDGQHRATAAKARGDIKQLPCLVIEADYATQARAFATINGQVTKVSPQMIHRARAAAGEKDALELNRICARAGVVLLAYPKPATVVGETMSVGTIAKCLARFGEKVLVTALETVTRTSDGNPGMLREGIIAGTCDVLAENPKWPSDQVVAVVDRLRVRRLYEKAYKAKADAVAGTMSIRLYYANALRAGLTAALGTGASLKPAQQTATAPKGVTPATDAEILVRERRVINAANSTRNVRAAPPKAVMKVDERAAIDDFLKTKGARKLESGASGHTSNIIDWLNHNGHPASRTSTASGNRKPYIVDGRKYDLEGLIVRLNQIRKSKKLEPLSLAGVA